LAAKLAGIKNISSYSFLKKNKLNLVKSAKQLTEKFLQITNCPTETKFFIEKKSLNKIKEKIDNKLYKIVIGAGSSGPTTRWGANNFAHLINKLNDNANFFFFILCGPNEKEIENQIVNNINKKNFLKLSDKSLKEVIPYLCSSNLYVGNDSFGSHITSQSGIKSLVILLDTPKTYTDYSKNYYRIIPNRYDINLITHGSNINPNLVSVNDVYSVIMNFKNAK